MSTTCRCAVLSLNVRNEELSSPLYGLPQPALAGISGYAPLSPRCTIWVRDPISQYEENRYRRQCSLRRLAVSALAALGNGARALEGTAHSGACHTHQSILWSSRSAQGPGPHLSFRVNRPWAREQAQRPFKTSPGDLDVR